MKKYISDRVYEVHYHEFGWLPDPKCPCTKKVKSMSPKCSLPYCSAEQEKLQYLLVRQ
jgi:hypothetical protein